MASIKDLLLGAQPWQGLSPAPKFKRHAPKATRAPRGKAKVAAAPSSAVSEASEVGTAMAPSNATASSQALVIWAPGANNDSDDDGDKTTIRSCESAEEEDAESAEEEDAMPDDDQQSVPPPPAADDGRAQARRGYASSGSSDLGREVWAAIGKTSGSATLPPSATSVGDGYVFCTKCRQEVPPHRAQLIGKSSGSWKCNSCNCRIVQLNRAFGSWPPPEFDDIGPEEKAEFYRRANQLVDGKKVVNLAKRCLEKVFIRRFIEGSGGSYLPLSVYKQQGYDIAKIEAECKDTMKHPIFGLVYRVAIWSKRSENESESRNVQTMLAEGQLKAKVKREKRKLGMESANKGGDPRPSKKSSSSSSSSASSSSSDASEGHKRKAKAKKAKEKERKAKKAAQKAKKRQAKKEKKKAKNEKAAQEERKKKEKEEKLKQRVATKEANKLKTKLGPMVASLSRALADELAKQLPPANTKAGHKFLKELLEFEAAADKVVNGEAAALTISVESVEGKLKLAKKELQLLDGFLGALRKHKA